MTGVARLAIRDAVPASDERQGARHSSDFTEA